MYWSIIRLQWGLHTCTTPLYRSGTRIEWNQNNRIFNHDFFQSFSFLKEIVCYFYDYFSFNWILHFPSYLRMNRLAYLVKNYNKVALSVTSWFRVPELVFLWEEWLILNREWPNLKFSVVGLRLPWSRSIRKTISTTFWHLFTLPLPICFLDTIHVFIALLMRVYIPFFTSGAVSLVTSSEWEPCDLYNRVSWGIHLLIADNDSRRKLDP